MNYIKYEGDFYKKVELKELSKEELIELIQNTFEVKNKTDIIYSDEYFGYPYQKPYIPCQSNISGVGGYAKGS